MAVPMRQVLIAWALMSEGLVTRAGADDLGAAEQLLGRASVGDDFASFLAGRGAWCWLCDTREDDRDPAPVLNALGVPDELRALSLDELYDDQGLARFLRWASPNLPDPHPDPYIRGLSAEEI